MSWALDWRHDYRDIHRRTHTLVHRHISLSSLKRCPGWWQRTNDNHINNFIFARIRKRRRPTFNLQSSLRPLMICRVRRFSMLLRRKNQLTGLFHFVRPLPRWFRWPTEAFSSRICPSRKKESFKSPCPDQWNLYIRKYSSPWFLEGVVLSYNGGGKEKDSFPRFLNAELAALAAESAVLADQFDVTAELAKSAYGVAWVCERVTE